MLSFVIRGGKDEACLFLKSLKVGFIFPILLVGMLACYIFLWETWPQIIMIIIDKSIIIIIIIIDKSIIIIIIICGPVPQSDPIFIEIGTNIIIEDFKRYSSTSLESEAFNWENCISFSDICSCRKPWWIWIARRVTVSSAQTTNVIFLMKVWNHPSNRTQFIMPATAVYKGHFHNFNPWCAWALYKIILFLITTKKHN